MTHILCPIDFSEPSRTALRYAAALARRHNARLTVLFVNDPLLASAAAAAAYDVRKLAAKTDIELKGFIRRTLGSSGTSLGRETALGHPAPEIEKAVNRLGVDFVVMGTNGLSGPVKWFLGSTTERLLRSTKVPVLVVPNLGRTQAARAAALKGWPGRRALAPIDLDDDSVSLAQAAVDAARGLGAAATLLHVVATPTLPAWMGIDTGASTRRRYDEAWVRLEAIARRVRPRTRSQVRSGDPAEQIAASAADLKVRLVVLTLLRSGAIGHRRGSIAYRLLCTGGVPVLALPPADATR